MIKESLKRIKNIFEVFFFWWTLDILKLLSQIHFIKRQYVIKKEESNKLYHKNQCMLQINIGQAALAKTAVVKKSRCLNV